MRMAKYSANGNDFVIFHTDVKENRSELTKKLCHRQDGIGADGLIVIVPNSDYDFEWQFYNADGSDADMCGNGSRACAHYAYTHNLASNSMKFLTGAGVIKAQVENDLVQVELTPPNIIDKNIEFNSKDWWLLDTGVPHLVHFTQNIEEFDIQEARELRYKYNANVNIAFIDANKNIKVRTYERGVEDETLACGTGMAACFYRAYTEEKVAKTIEVYPRSNETVYLGVNNNTITFKGAVKNTFNTEWNI
ncbi:MAG: diaminopimelate epimerase [Sulfurimonas sp.]|jgi:diaminopimelate epimerase